MEIKKRFQTYVISLLITVIVIRTFLTVLPFFNFNLGHYNIHHFFVGALLIIISILCLIVNIAEKFSIIIAGIGSALVLDEIVYLIATDGSDLSYLTPLSLIGSIILNASILILIIILYYNAKKR